jgi:hypothetical protein
VSRLSTSITRRIAAGLVALVAVVGLSTVSAQPASAAVTRQLTTASCTIDNLWPAADETKIYKLEYERISGNGQVRLVSVGASGGKNQGPKIYTSNQATQPPRGRVPATTSRAPLTRRHDHWRIP